MSGGIAYRVWNDGVGFVGGGIANVRMKFLMQLREIVEAFTELVGTMIFALLGGVADPTGTGRDGWPALGNGLTLAVMIYMCAKVSGGKLNPAVSFGLLISGAISPLRCLVETFMQILGGILGAAMSKYLTAGTDDSTPGCFVPSHGVTNDQVFFWEFFSTFVLVSVVFATAVDDTAASHFVSVAPLAIGLSLFACAQACGPFTGGCLNPARFLGPAVVFGCGWPYIHAYLFGHYCGGALAGFLFRLRMKLQELYQEAAKQNQHQQLTDSSSRLDQEVELN